MAYKLPSRRRRAKKGDGINLTPILDAVFIFIFFLILSAQFIKTFEINSDIPLVSDEPPPPNQKPPLALTVRIDDNGFTLLKGVPSQTFDRVEKVNGEFDLLKLHSIMIDLKQKYLDENMVILEPITDLTYEELVKIMDAVRLLNKTDPEIYKKDKDGIDTKVNDLFNKIVFGNLMS